MAKHFHLADLRSKAERMNDCADQLVFRQGEEGLKLYQTWFCKVRLCPMCNWRRSMKIAYHNKKIVETVNEREKVQWLFLTLTVRNTDAVSLPETISGMFQGFNRLTKYKAVQKVLKGYFRALEVTKNRDATSLAFGTYHPHFHVLLCVPNSYFKKQYIKQSEWVAHWRKAMKLDYDPIVHIQKVKPKKELGDMEKLEDEVKKSIQEQNAIFEVSKYPVKDTDIISGKADQSENVETVSVLDKALAHKRLIGYGGLLKEIHKELNLDDPEDGDLVNVSEEDEVANGTFDVIARWHVGLKNYLIEN